MFQFAGFAFDAESGDLTRGGTVVRLTPQTAQVLRVFIERPGQVVSRAELRERIWPDTAVEFDQGLNFCIRQLRVALDDDAGRPKYIETLPRRGYRFIAAVSSADADVAASGQPAREHSVRATANWARRPLVL